MEPEPTAASPRRVTVVAHELRGFRPVGGMGTATTFLALALARMGHSVDVLLGVMHRPESIDPYWDDVYRQAGIAIRAAPPSSERVEPWPFLRARSIELGLREDPPDVVIAHEFGAPAYTALRVRQAGLAFDDTLFVVFCHGSRRYALDLAPNLAPKDLRHVLAVGVHEQASVELADVAVSPSAYLLDWMRGQRWRLPEQAFVIPYFARTDVMGESRAVAADVDGGRELERLAFFGRLDERKGLRVFAAALNALDPELLEGLEVEFIGKTTATWTRDRVEGLFADQTKRALRRIGFETELDQHEALARLRRAGTLAVMPSLGETFSNTVYECLEHRIPFIASNVGGVPELVAPDEHPRVLFEPTGESLEAALRAALADRRVPRPARPAFDSRASFERWAEVVEMRPRATTRTTDARVDVVVVHRGSRDALSRCLRALGGQTFAGFRIVVAAAGCAPPDDIRADAVVRSDGASVESARRAGLGAVSAPYVVFLDEEDVPDAELLQTLVRAQAASGADVVTCGVRLTPADGEPTLHFFSGDPGGLGALANAYGTVALFRREALDDVMTPWAAERDADWPLLAGRTASGARVLSVPAALVTRAAGVGSVEDDPSDALLVVQELERALPASLRGTARLAAGLAANAPRDGGRRTPAVGIAIVALTLAAAALRLSTLGGQSYWYDELVTVSLLHRPFAAMLHAVPRSEATPYLYYVLAWPWTRLFGFGEAGLRSLSAVAGTLTVPATYAAGAALVSRRVGVVAAALAAVNPFLVWYSQEARAYALFALAAALTVYFFGRALRNDRHALVGWAITAAVAVATHYFAVFVVAAEAGALVLRQRWRGVAATALPTAVLLAEAPLMLEQRNNGGNLSDSPLLHRVAGIPKDLVVGYSFPAELAGTIAGALLVLVGVALALVGTPRGLRRGAFVAGAITAFALVFPVALAAAGADYVIARNMIAVVVPAAIFVAAGYTARPAGVIAAALLCALSLAISLAVAADPRYGRTDWRGAARELQRTRAVRAIVATPTIAADLWRPYLAGLREPSRATVRVDEVDVVALATQGGFSAAAVHPPRTPPRAAPSGFRLVSAKRTSTFVLVRYRSPRARQIGTDELAALALGPLPATVLLQSPTSGAPS